MVHERCHHELYGDGLERLGKYNGIIVRLTLGIGTVEKHCLFHGL
jgi:hypothetical protein